MSYQLHIDWDKKDKFLNPLYKSAHIFSRLSSFFNQTEYVAFKDHCKIQVFCSTKNGFFNNDTRKFHQFLAADLEILFYFF